MLFFPRPSRRIGPSFLAAFIVFSAGTGRSQPADGFTVQERPGIIIVKPQPWSKESDAMVFEFQAFIDRTASGAAGAGYYEFRAKQGDKRQIPTSRVVKLIVYPDPQLVWEVTKTEDRQSLQNTINEIKAVIAKFPASRTYVEPPLKKLEDEAALYDAGKVKFEGLWISRDAFVKTQAANLAELLKAEIVRAIPPSSFDLPNDPKYLALVEFSATSPGIKALTAELAASYGKLVRAEKRKALLMRLADASLTLPAATEAVSQLKALQPAEDAKSAAFVKLWDTGSATLKSTMTEASTLAASLEGELSANKTEDAAPKLSPELDAAISALNEKMTLLVASKPPPQFLTGSRQALAVCAAGTGFKKLQTIFADKRFLEAKDLLDNLSRQTPFIGPESTRVVTGLQQFTATEIDEFTRLREEAKLLSDSGKKTEALGKYEAAYSVIPDNSVGDEIAKLKPAAPAAPK